ncbi:MAG TPA: glycoside hydrolase family 16 protein [Flavipsychrobacter sp.]|nr:glycoside hydrolase family 16 protein [Flavipsychrobacter sp.]
MKPTFLILLLLFSEMVNGQQTVQFSKDTNLCETDNWKLMWRDEFEGNEINRQKWYTFIDDENWVDGSVADPPIAVSARATKKAIYKGENVVVKDGHCTLIMKYDPSEWMGVSRNFSSAMIMAKNFEGTAPLYFVRGRYEIRAKLPRATGVWATFWLYGGGDKNNHGSEIDMVEYTPCRSSLDRLPYHVHGFHRGNDYSEHYETGGDYKVKNVDDWHVYTTEWDKHFIRFYMDGVLKATVSRYESDCNPTPLKEYVDDEKNVFPRIDEGMKMLVTLDYTHNLYSRQLAGICLPMPEWLRNRDRVDAKQPEQKFIIDYIRVYQRESEVQDYLKHND